MAKLRSNLFLLLLILALPSLAQEDGFKYKRKIGDPKPNWYQIELPGDIYGKLNTDFSDIRILGTDAEGDTIETPYLLKVMSDDYLSQRIDFKLLNETHNNRGYYYTFKLPEKEVINRINLEFSRSDFDWLVNLEGSNDQNEWFDILEKQRILSFHNQFTNYQYTRLHFGEVSYQYFRLHIPASKKPELSKAILSRNSVVEGEKVPVEFSHYMIIENKKTNQTEITIDLKSHQPISLLKLKIKDTVDYYRPVKISYVRDSVKTEKGWKYVYNTLKTDVISSLEPASFTFPNTIAKQIRIRISNGDNQPLEVSGTEVLGDVHKLIARFTYPATYYMVYGNHNAEVPNYDISRFTERIPDNPEKIKLADEEVIDKGDIKQAPQLFENSSWLWGVLVITILILGWFSLKMIRTK